MTHSCYFVARTDGDQTLAHHGILGQKWGVRRFQNKDGTLTAEGKRRQKVDSSSAEKGSSESVSTGRKRTSTEFASELKKDEGRSAYLKIANSKEFTDLAVTNVREEAKLYDKYFDDMVEAGQIRDKYAKLADKAWSYTKWKQISDEGLRKSKEKTAPYRDAMSKLNKANNEKKYALACKILNVEDVPENRDLIDEYMLFEQQPAYDEIARDLLQDLESEIYNKHQKSR